MKFEVRGVTVKITFLFTALVAFLISMNTNNVLITLVSSLLHEAGHLFVMCRSGCKPLCVSFEITGMNIIRNSDLKISLKNELLISVGGPLINFIIVLVCGFLYCFYQKEIILTFAVINLILMIFNLLPIKGLDGGRTLLFLMSEKMRIENCILILKITSAIFIILIYLWGFYVLFVTRYNFSLLIIAVFLSLSAISKNDY